MLSVDREKILEELLSGFNPAQNEADRRILFELTGLRLYHDEFKDHDTSSSEEEEESGVESSSYLGNYVSVDTDHLRPTNTSQLT